MSRTDLASRVFCRTGLCSLLRRTGGHLGFVVLNYHRVGDPSPQSLDNAVFSASANMFREQLRFLRSECDVITPDQIKDVSRRGRGNYVMITFDDGYRDNHQFALPLLRDAGLKATFFIATGFMDRPRLSWWDEIAWMVRNSESHRIGPTPTLPVDLPLNGTDRQPAIDTLLGIYKRLPSEAAATFLDDLAAAARTGRAPEELGKSTWLTWDMVRELRDAGMIIGGHTVHHPILSSLTRFEQGMEITGCAKAIERQLGQPMRYFSYPCGKPYTFNDDTRACLQEAHVEYAFSYYGGMNHSETLEPLNVRRVSVETDTLIEHFEAMVTFPRVFARGQYE